MRNLYCLVGPSGVGKTTVESALVSKGFRNVKSMTTRPPRKNDNSHTFVTKAEFDAVRNDLCAYTEFCGYEYGVTPEMLDNADIYVIDPDGVEFLRKKYTNKPVCVIGLYERSGILAERMRSRGDPEEKVAERLEHDRGAFSTLPKMADVMIRADQEQSTVDNVLRYIKTKENVA